jgi:SAM-dependent methyltransferase
MAMSRTSETSGPTQQEEGPSVDQVMNDLLGDLAASIGVLVTDLGLRTGLWRSMRGAGWLKIPDLATGSGVAAPLVREWVRSQSAAGYLSYDAATDSYALPEPVAIALLDAPGGAMVAACTEMFQSMLASYDDLVASFTAGGGFGWHQRDRHHWHGTDRLTRAQLAPELIAAAIAEIPGVAAALAAGGRILDVGCGFGFPTAAMAQAFPAATAVGIDYHRTSIDEARATAERAGVADRTSFAVASAADPPGSDYALVTYFDSLHDFGDPIAALRAARSALAPGGAVLVCDNDAAEQLVDNLNPIGRMYYGVSTLICTPNAISQHSADSPEPLGTYAGAGKIIEVARAAGFSRARRLDLPGALNLFLDLRP